MTRRVRFLLIVALLGLIAVAIALAVIGYRQATAFPVVTRYDVHVPGWQAGRPLKVAFLADIHAVLPDMPAERVRGIVAAVNRLQPDLVLLGGDYVSVRRLKSGPVATEAAIAPLGDLRAPLGVVAVLGNHDWKRGGEAVARALQRRGIIVLRNSAVLRGDVAVMGTDDAVTEHGNLGPAKSAMARLTRTIGGPDRFPGPVLLVAHSPAMAHFAAPYIDLTLAGHTHGGQMLPWLSRTLIERKLGSGLSYGQHRLGGHDVIVTAGIGASIVPLRLGVPPEIVLVRLVP